MGITPAMLMGGLGAGVGGAGLFGAFGSPSNVQLPPQQNWPIGPAFARGAGAIGDLGQYNIGGQFLGDVSGIARGFMANPYAGGFQGGANLFGGLGQLNALGGLGMAGQIGGTVAPQIGAAGAILNQAFDPQQALYQRTAQQVGEQSLAGLSQSGLAGTPWGQGVAGKTMADFNIDWQNNLLNRMGVGAEAARGLYGGALGSATGAFGLGSSAIGAGLGSAQAPWSAYNAILGGALQGPQAAAQFGNLTSTIPQLQAGDWLNYMGQVNAANQVGNQQAQLALSQQNQQFNQQQAWLRQFGGGMGLMFPPGGGWGPFGGGGGGYYGGSPETNPNLRPI